MEKITPCLWFKDNAEEAINYYVSVFRDAKILHMQRMPENGPGPAGSLLIGSFELYGHRFQALNGFANFTTSPSVSFSLTTKDQEETDYYWDTLINDGGKASQCGWLQDKFGFSWQIVPEALPRLMSQPDREKGQRVMQAMMKMQKIIIADLEAAAQ